jgi:23S rRNA pseudouridine1911/1915/1917 synthase
MAEIEVPAQAAGTRLDVFLADHAGSRAAAQKLIDAGRVTVDGAGQPKRHALAAGARIAIAEAAPVTTGAAVPTAGYAIAYRDDDVLVIDKPAGVVVHPGSGRAEGTLVQALGGLVAGGDDPLRPGIVHRLDRDTSGLLVVARHERAHAELKRQIAGREVLREYLALVEGRPAARAGTIDAPLGRDRRVRTRISTDSDEPRDAVTHFEIERGLRDCTLLRVWLQTGRTHQIRAHLSAIGNRVLGDPEYGVPGALGLERQFLHAARLAFDHPVTGERVDVKSPLPADLAAALERAAA